MGMNLVWSKIVMRFFILTKYDSMGWGFFVYPMIFHWLEDALEAAAGNRRKIEFLDVIKFNNNHLVIQIKTKDGDYFTITEAFQENITLAPDATSL